MIGNCKDCIYWHGGSYYTGDCFRYPPMRVGSHETKYPTTDTNDCCGEHVSTSSVSAMELKQIAAIKDA